MSSGVYTNAEQPLIFWKGAKLVQPMINVNTSMFTIDAMWPTQRYGVPGSDGCEPDGSKRNPFPTCGKAASELGTGVWWTLPNPTARYEGTVCPDNVTSVSSMGTCPLMYVSTPTASPGFTCPTYACDVAIVKAPKIPGNSRSYDTRVIMVLLAFHCIYYYNLHYKKTKTTLRR